MAAKKRPNSPKGTQKSAYSNSLKANSTSWIKGASGKKKAGPKKLSATILVFAEGAESALQQELEDLGAQWQTTWLTQSSQPVLRLTGNQGPLWVVRPEKIDTGVISEAHSDRLKPSDYALYRDYTGAALAQTEEFATESIQVHFHGCSDEAVLGGLVGLDLASYRFLRAVSGQGPTAKSLELQRDQKALDKKLISKASALAGATNMARHLVNLPPNILNPESYAQMVKSLFAGSKTTKVDVWDEARLQKENMGLMMAVGRGAEHAPRLVHIRYRPQKNAKKKPIAFIGKGITFDSGGLDIKPSSGMRNMKKDMGGSAAVCALAYWVEQVGLKQPCDFYLALAENAVDERSFRPGDVFTARNGLKVEIHNTDAEGRLVMADALDVAVTQKGSDEPQRVIDVATLTGAVKVGLGAELAGLFSTDDSLAECIEQAAQKRGDLCWRMPLYRPYFAAMQSSVADCANAVNGFGGAITAALFLEKFTGSKPWAHLDIYAWKDSAQGAWAEGGGSGQAVQALTEMLEQISS